MGTFIAEKVYDGYSTVFRQWKATDTHCSFLHGYGVSFKVTFEGDIDYRNWVFDFGGMKRAKTLIDGKQPKKWMDYMFDLTTIIAEDDPILATMLALEDRNMCQVRVIPATGAEKFAEYIYNKLQDFVNVETDGRVRIQKVKFMEHAKNSASFGEF